MASTMDSLFKCYGYNWDHEPLAALRNRYGSALDGLPGTSHWPDTVAAFTRDEYFAAKAAAAKADIEDRREPPVFVLTASRSGSALPGLQVSVSCCSVG